MSAFAWDVNDEKLGPFCVDKADLFGVEVHLACDVSKFYTTPGYGDLSSSVELVESGNSVEVVQVDHKFVDDVLESLDVVNIQIVAYHEPRNGHNFINVNQLAHILNCIQFRVCWLIDQFSCRLPVLSEENLQLIVVCN